ncbi:MAG: RHS repeat protein [Acidobacteria bacterium]|nr:RHS repeat protein [Acidobacteriota bacterium]
MPRETGRFQRGNFQLVVRIAAVQRPVSSWLWVATLVVLLASLNLPASVVKFAYDEAGRLIKADYGNGIAITYLYDNAGNLLSRRVGVSTVGLYFPFYQSDASSLTAFAVSNFSDKSATLDFTLFGNDGRLPALANNPTTLQLPAQNQLARIGIELFGVSPSTSQSGWVQLTSDNSEITSFFQYLGPSQLDGS